MKIRWAVFRFFGFLFPFLLAACAQGGPSPEAILYTVSAGSNPQVVAQIEGVSLWGPSVSPDGQTIAVTYIDRSNESAEELVLLDLDGSNLRPLTENGRSNYLPSWSPDGQQIAFVSQEGSDTDTAEIFVINIDGSGQRQLTDNEAFEYGVDWAPDGNRLYFGSNRGGRWMIYTMNSDGSNQKALDTPSHGNDPALSPDGRRLVVISDRDGEDDVWIMNADGSDQRNLTDNSIWENGPRWSPDGSKIIFASGEEESVARLFTISPDGGNVQLLSDAEIAGVCCASWSPDGSKIIFHGYPQ